MAQNATSAALQSLTEWWEDMGVEVNHAELARIQQVQVPQKPPPNPATRPLPGGRKNRTVKAQTLDLAAWTQAAEQAAEDAQNLESLKHAIEQFEGSPLKPLCNKTVVYDGQPGAPIMVIGEGPGGQEDRQGLPFVGKAGQLLDKMLAAIALDRQTNTFITNVNFWRPPGNRNPEPDELAVCRPFVDRMIDLGQPKLIIATGGVAAKSLLNTRTGIMRLRGQEQSYTTPAGTAVPLIPIFHPAYLLRRPQDKSRTWRDLLRVQAHLQDLGVQL